MRNMTKALALFSVLAMGSCANGLKNTVPNKPVSENGKAKTSKQKKGLSLAQQQERYRKTFLGSR
jgi:hypothetical protein